MKTDQHRRGGIRTHTSTARARAGQHDHIRTSVSDESGLRGVMTALAYDGFVSGSEPFGETRTVARPKEIQPRVAGGRLVRVLRDGRADRWLFRGAGFTVTVDRWEHAAVISVTAADDQTVGRKLTELVDQFEPAEVTDESVPVGFWHRGSHGARRIERPLDAPLWNVAARNYTQPVRDAVDGLVELRPSTDMPRLLLVHGPPGTGKTNLLRVLAREWREWCRVDVVVDPDEFLASPSYLVQVMGEAEDDESWRLLLLEDCDEAISAQARGASGQGLSRLLNLTDGMLGQGTRLLVAISTNEPLDRLHPAVIRPGRCLAELHVGHLTRAEAIAWQGDADGIGADGASLASLYSRRQVDEGRASVRVRAAAPAATGQYL